MGELEEAGRRLVNAPLGEAGESNPWAASAELLVSPWLAA
ncbi:MAG: Mu-like prophage major head subunit gpT family protein [Alkalilacustris sp.]